MALNLTFWEAVENGEAEQITVRVTSYSLLTAFAKHKNACSCVATLQRTGKKGGEPKVIWVKPGYRPTTF